MTARICVLMATVATLVVAAPASAGSFVVRSCGATASKNASAWVLDSGGGPLVSSGNSCNSTSDPVVGGVAFAGGFWVRDARPAELLLQSAGRMAGYRFAAPANSSLTAITYDRHLSALPDIFQVRLTSNIAGAPLEDCAPETYGCPEGARANVSFALPTGTTSLDLSVWCVGGTCFSSAGPLYDFAAVIYSSEVTIAESVLPTVEASVEGAAQGWVSGSGRVVVSGSDTLGIRTLEVRNSAGQVLWTKDGVCVDWSTTPCAEVSAGGSEQLGGSVTATELGLGTGVHELTVAATDAAGNTATQPLTLQVATSTPGIAVSGGGTSVVAQRSFGWQVQSTAPVASAIVKLCRAANPCTSQPVRIDGPFVFSLGAGERATAQVTITDAVGNEAVTAPLSFDRPALLKSKLKVSVGSQLSKRLITLRGSIAAGSATTIPLKLAGTSKAGKRITLQRTITVNAAGKFTLRLKTPSQLNTRRRVKLIFTPQLVAGYEPLTYTHSINP